MKIRLSLGIFAACTSVLSAQTFLDDSWPTGSLAKDQPLEGSWHPTSGSTAIEGGVGYMGLVSGSSGRAIHGVFNTASLNLGEVLVARFTFNTPATVSEYRGGGLRIALLNSSGVDMAQDFSYSGANPNANLDPPLGYWMDFSVSSSDSGWNEESTPSIAFRESLVPRTSGRLLGTTAGGWEALESGGDPYLMLPSSTYTGQFSIERTGVDAVTLSGSLELDGAVLSSFSTSDTGSGIVSSFDVIAFAALSNTFGSSNSVGDPDNGIQFTNINISVIPEPSTYALLFGAFGLAWVLIRRRRR